MEMSYYISSFVHYINLPTINQLYTTHNHTTMTVKFGYTILYVPDVVKTIEFYEKAFSFERKFITPDGSYGEIKTGETTISFLSNDYAKQVLSNEFVGSNSSNKPLGVELCFVTENVDQTIQQAVEAGATLYVKPELKPWGQLVSYVRDINGFLIEICTHNDD